MILDNPSDLYKFILNEIFTARKIDPSSSKAQADYLISLQPIASNLWRSYQKHSINVDYENQQNQECYLLRYFVPYTYFLSSVMLDSNIVENIKSGEKITLTCFGAGAGPELVSILRLIENSEVKPKSLEIGLVDYSDWSFSQKIIIKYLKELTLKFKFDFEVLIYVHDFSEPLKDDSEIINSISRSQLIVFQNSINEYTYRGSELINFQTILEKMPNTSKIIFIDQSENYRNREELLRQLELVSQYSEYKFKKLAENNYFALNLTSLKQSLPDLIDGNLYAKYKEEPFWSEGLVLRFSFKLSYIFFGK